MSFEMEFLKKEKYVLKLFKIIHNQKCDLVNLYEHQGLKVCDLLTR
jgi:hypothetical protein